MFIPSDICLELVGHLLGTKIVGKGVQVMEEAARL